jgi:hypothetical protein
MILTIAHLLGEDQNYIQRIYLLYDGIHYDPVAYTFAKELPEDSDVTIFSPQDSFVERNVLALVHQNRKVKYPNFLRVVIVENPNLIII